MEIGDIATWLGSIAALVTGLAAIAISVQLRRRDRRLALADLHHSLTSGETAEARNLIGTLLYGLKSDQPGRAEAIEAYFKLIWAVQRARNVFRAYGLRWELAASPQTRRHLSDAAEINAALSWNLGEIVENLVTFHKEYAELWSVEDSDAWSEMSEYLRVDPTPSE